MSKRLLLIVSMIVITIFGGAAYLFIISSNKDDKPQTTGSSEQTNTSNVATTSGGAYIDYQDNVIANTHGTKLLFFHAPWCPQCRDLEADIKAKGVPDGVTIIKVDYDTSQELRQKYGVTLQTTIVKVDDSGKLVEKFVAYDDPSVAAVANKLL
jgi:thiol-disulfide isomerase/thioredoxin